MIRYSLKCRHGHSFESWFKSADAFEALKRSGHLTCAVCGDSAVEKALMAPQVRPARDAVAAPNATHPDSTHPAPDTTAPAHPLAPAAGSAAAQLARLRRAIEENSEYVGLEFVTEARRIHDGDAPERPIYGEARLDEARALLEDGVPVAPLPFAPGRKTN